MLYFFPRDVLDEIWNLIVSVSEGFPLYSFMKILFRNKATDAINISNILNHKDVKAAIPPYLKKSESSSNFLFICYQLQRKSLITGM